MDGDNYLTKAETLTADLVMGLTSGNWPGSRTLRMHGYLSEEKDLECMLTYKKYRYMWFPHRMQAPICVEDHDKLS